VGSLPPGLAFVDAERVMASLSYSDAVDAMEKAFRSDDLSAGVLRSHLTLDGGDLIVMPGALPGAAGVKLLTLNRGNPARGHPLIQGVYVLFGGDTLAPRAIIDGAALTALRTAAVSALATRHLAREDASHLAIFGAGAQAHAHLAAMCAVRSIERLSVIGPNPDRVASLVESGVRIGLAASAAEPGVVAEADIVCTCTTSGVPVFPGRELPAGVHVNAVGSHRPDARELDEHCLSGATVVVESREAALAEAGDLLLAIAAGALTADDVAGDLPDVVHGRVRRSGAGEITVFKSVGLALEDLALARAIVDAD
jgi:ornithine cyclodeaminase